jgi:hypothetical protein
MKVSEESSVVRNDLGELLRELSFIDRRWIRVDSCSNNTFLPHEDEEEVDYFVGAFCDILGVSGKKANGYYLSAFKLPPERCTLEDQHRKRYHCLSL